MPLAYIAIATPLPLFFASAIIIFHFAIAC